MEYYIDEAGMAVFDTLKVGGSLDLSGTAITSLPDGLTVGGSLDLSGTAITSLPDGLTVGGSLDLSDTAITSLPDGLKVGGSLYLSGTAITSLPDGLTVGGVAVSDAPGVGIAHCGMRARTPDEATANARLIAAAPELLAALEKALPVLLSAHEADASIVSWVAYCDARDAILNAKNTAT